MECWQLLKCYVSIVLQQYTGAASTLLETSAENYKLCLTSLAVTSILNSPIINVA